MNKRTGVVRISATIIRQIIHRIIHGIIRVEIIFAKQGLSFAMSTYIITGRGKAVARGPPPKNGMSLSSGYLVCRWTYRAATIHEAFRALI
jgi:hypothetical protein